MPDRRARHKKELFSPVLRGRPARNVLEDLREIVGIGIADARADFVYRKFRVGKQDFREIDP